jgi:hypothetical protein
LTLIVQNSINYLRWGKFDHPYKQATSYNLYLLSNPRTAAPPSKKRRKQGAPEATPGTSGRNRVAAAPEGFGYVDDQPVSNSTSNLDVSAASSQDINTATGE